VVGFIEAQGGEDWAALRSDAGGTAALLESVSRRAQARLHPTPAPHELSHAQLLKRHRQLALRVLGNGALARRIASRLGGDEGALVGGAMVAAFCPGAGGGLTEFTYRASCCSPYAFIALAGRLPDLRALSVQDDADWGALEASEPRWLERLPQLQALQLSLKAEGADGAPLAALSGLSALSALRLTCPRLRMLTFLAALPAQSLTLMQLDNSSVDYADDELAGFTRLSRLQRLSIDGCRGASRGPSLALNDFLPRLKSASRGSGAPALPALESLRAGFCWCARGQYLPPNW